MSPAETLQLEQDYEGFASAQLETLQKALTAGSGVDAGSFTGGRALIPESLDNTLVNILHDQDEAVLFQRLKRKPIQSPVHQWDVRDEVGADDGAWVPEGGTAEEADQTIERKYTTVKYLQTLRKVTLQATISNMIEDAMVLEQNAGTLWLIRNIESALFYANSSYVSHQPDGLIAQIPSTNVLDVRGATAATSTFEEKMNDGSRIIREGYGRADLFLSSPRVMQDVQNLIRDRILFNGGGRVEGGSAIFDRYPTPFGNIEIKEDIFIKQGAVPAASSLTSKVPGQPSIGSVTTPADSDSQFAAADVGQYIYKIVPVNRYGDGTASAEKIVADVAAGDKVVLPVTKGSGADPTAYKVYRSKKGATTGGTVRYMKTVAYSASPQNIEDYNADLPGTVDGFMLTMNQVHDAIEWAQFLPMMKFDLYPTNAAVYPFLMLLFGSLALKKPVQHVRIKNISPADLGWF